MKKKLLFGMVSLSAMGGFVACGDGNINNMTPNDESVSVTYSSDEYRNDLKESAMQSCKNTPDCYSMYQGYLDGTEEPSSEPGQSSDSNVPRSSNGSILPVSSSSIEFASRSSSSISIIDPGVSSSSITVVDDKTFGTCKPKEGTITKGGSVQWIFEVNTSFVGYNLQEYIKPATTFAWNFPEGVDDGTQISSISGKVTYGTSGQKSASVVVTYQGTPYSINCTPLQVNGDPITCACSVKGGDVTTDQGVATWTAACTSDSDINNYSWDGVDGLSTTFTKTFAAKGDTYTPKLKVGNVDKTVQEVTCPELVATDASLPDYEIVESQAAGKKELPAGKTQVHVKVPVSGQSCVIFCETQWDETLQGALTMTVGGQKNSGAYNVTVTLPVDACDDDMVDFELSAKATCGVQ